MVLLRAGNKFAPTLNIRVDELLTTVLRNHPNIEEIELFPGARHIVTECKEKFNINSYSEIIGDRKNNGENTAISGGDD
uniref:Long-chain-fatty-acid--CoA ligase n=1 Tax=Strongyloides papillosus TaxID=174720 RepID=A0A0N5C1M5_STREA